MVWIDTETTGLSEHDDLLLEIAVIITDDALNPMFTFDTVILQDMSAVDERLSRVPEVADMHRNSGLRDELSDRTLTRTLAHAEQFILHGLRLHGALGAAVAGNSISFDRRFLTVHMPTLNKTLHYRNIDVSTLKEVARRFRPDLFASAPKKQLGHRALDDILESIEEFQHYLPLLLETED